MSPRRERGTCRSSGCSQPSRARSLCWGHYRKWRRALPDGGLEQIPAGALTAAQVAAHLGITPATLTRHVARGEHLPDGRTQGRNWWHPDTVVAWDDKRPPADALTVRDAAQLLGVSTSRVHALANSGDLPADGRLGGRRALWWHRATIEGYRARQPRDVLWTSDVAALLDVSRETVRRLAATTLPPDGLHRGRRFWASDRISPQRDREARQEPPA